MKKSKIIVISILGSLILLLLIAGVVIRYGGFWKSSEPTYTVTVEKVQNGTVKLDKLVYKEGDYVTLKITPKEAYKLDTILVDGSDKTADVVNDELRVLIEADMNVSATFHEVVDVDTFVTIPDTCNMRGMELMLEETGETPIKVTVDDNNTFDLPVVSYGTKYDVTGTICGMQVSLGSLIIRTEKEEFDPSWLFNVNYDGTLDLAGGNFTYDYASNKKLTVSAKDGSVKKGDAWIATKISLSPEDVSKLIQTEGGEASFGIGMIVGDKNDYIDIWLKNWEITAPPETIYGIRSKSKIQNGVFMGAGLLTDYGKALGGDGLYFVLHYDAEDGTLESYLGDSVDTITKVGSWGTVFDKDSTLHAFKIGSNRAWGSTPVQVNFSNVKYAATLDEALGISDLTGSIDANLVSVKYGSSDTRVPDGTKVILTREGYKTINTKVKNGRLRVASIPYGTWTLTVNGYEDASIDVELDKKLSGDIEIQYALFKDYLREAGWNDYAALDKQNYGVIIQESGPNMLVATNDKYDSVAISLNLSTEKLKEGRHGTFVKFGNEYVFIQLESINDGEDYKISWNGFDTISNWPPEQNNVNLKPEYWKSQVSKLSAEQIAGLNDGSLYFTLAREKNTIYAFVDGQYCNKVVLDEKYADMQCQVGLYGTSVKKGMVRNFKIEDGESYLSAHPTSGSVDAKVTGQKYNVDGNTLPDGTEITFSFEKEKKIVKIKDGRISLKGLDAGVWTMTAGDYIHTITIETGVTHTSDIVMGYDLFTDYLKEAGWNDYADLSKQNAGVITQESGPNMFIATNDKFDSVAISMNLAVERLKTGRHGTFVKFNNEYVFIQLEPLDNGNSYKITWNGFNTIYSWPPATDEIKNVNLLKDKWTAQVDPLSARQISGLNDGSLYFTLVREGNVIYAFVDGQYCNKVVLDEKYADMECQVGLYGLSMSAGMVRNFKIEDGAEYLSVHPTTGAVDAKVTGHKYNVDGNTLSDGTEITFTLGKEQKTAKIKDGKISLKNLDAGVWTMTAGDYVKKITIAIGVTHTDDIVMEYDLFTDYLREAKWNDYADLSQQNYGVITQESGPNMLIATNDTYDSVAISLNMSTEGLTGGRHGTFIKFNNEYVFIQLEPLNGGSSYKITWNGDNQMYSWPPATDEVKNVNLLKGTWTAQVEPLSSEQIARLNDGSLYFTLVREGNVIYAFVDGQYCNKVVLDEKYADMECQVGLYGLSMSAGMVRNFKIEEASVYPTSGAVDANILGHRYKVEGNPLSDGTEVTFTMGTETKSAKITDGKITLSDLDEGEWTLRAGKYEQKISIKIGVTHTDDIVMEYDLFTDYLREAKWNDYADLSQQNDGIITQESGPNMLIATNDTYDSVAISLNMSTEGLTGGRHGTFIKFNNEYVFIQLEPLNGGSSYKITWNGFNTIYSWPPSTSEAKNVNLLKDKWGAQVNPLSANQIAKLNDGSLYFTLVREGNIVYAYVDGVYCNKVVLAEKYTDMECQVGIYGLQMTAGMARNFQIEDGAEYLSVHPLPGAVNAKIIGHKHDVNGNALSDGTEVTFTKGTETKSAKIEEDKIVLDELAVGEWTVTVGNYKQKISIETRVTHTDDIIMEYDLFTDYLREAKWNDYADLSQQNDGIITQESGPNMLIATNDTYDSVAISLNMSTEGLTGGRHGTFIKFNNEYVFIQLEPLNGGSSYKITWNGFNTIYNWPPSTSEAKNVNLLKDKWGAQVNPLSANQIAKLNDGSLYFTLIREKNIIYAYVDGTYCNEVVLDEKYADMKCQVGIYGLQMTAGMVRNFKIDAGDDCTTGKIDANIIGKKLGAVADLLPDGTEVTLQLGTVVRTAVIQNGKISLEGLEPGVWSITAGKYSAEITIGMNVTHTDDIVMEYDLLTDCLSEGGWNSATDLSEQNEGIVTQEKGDTMLVVTNDTYNSVAISLNLSTEGLTSGRHGVFIKFGNEYVLIQLEPLKNGQSYKISWNGENTLKKWPPASTSNPNVNLIQSNWTSQVDPLSAEQITKLNDGSLYFTLVREGNIIYAYVDGTYCNKVELDEKYTEMKCQVGLYGTGMTTGMVRNFKIEEASVYRQALMTNYFMGARFMKRNKSYRTTAVAYVPHLTDEMN